MNTIYKQFLPAVLCMFLMASCASMQPTAQRTDDVYYLPSQAPMEVPEAAEAETPQQAQPTATSDDYYDANAAQQYNGQGNYYDMAYNDPYYYSYGRFGFGNGLGWQSGWNGPGWGMGMSWGYGSGVYSGWYRPTYWDMYGMYNWNSFGYGQGWNQWAWYNDPYYYNGYGSYGYGNGYGNYWGPWGNCGCGYTPIVIGGSSNTLVGHRPSLSGSSTASHGVYQNRSMYRDPIGLTGSTPNRGAQPQRAVTGRTTMPDQPIRQRSPERVPIVQPPTQHRTERRAPVERHSTPDRAPSHERSGGDRSGGGGSAPSRNDGGGTRSPGTHRSR